MTVSPVREVKLAVEQLIADDWTTPSDASNASDAVNAKAASDPNEAQV